MRSRKPEKLLDAELYARGNDPKAIFDGSDLSWQEQPSDLGKGDPKLEVGAIPDQEASDPPPARARHNQIYPT